MRRVGPITIAAALVWAGACGGSKTANNGAAPEAGAGDDAGDTSEASISEAGSDAEPPDDGPWPAAHYPMPMFTNLGGAVLATPKIVTVTFVGDPNRDAFRTFDDTASAGTPWWNAVTAGYGISAGTGGVYVELPDTVSNTTIDDTTQLEPMIAQLVASGALPTPDASTLYLFYFPSTTTITLQGSTSCVAFGGYHNSTTINLEAGIVDVPYAVIPSCPDPTEDGGTTPESWQEFTDAISHETIEAATNPHPEVTPAWYGYDDAWFRTPGATGGQGEVADVCERYQPATDANNDDLARAWVNQAAAASHDPCQPELPGEIFYSVAVPTTKVQSGTFGDFYTSDGYVLMKPGTTTTLDSVIFSEAQLPNDVAITVGARSHGALNPVIGTGISGTVTPTSGHNGMHVALTLTVASTATAADYPAVVRATLNTNDHHDWPIIIRVQ